MAALNAWLDSLPCSRFGERGREVPAFRTIGVAGFYLALFATIGTGLATGRSVVVLAVVSVACGLSFFGWALLRRLITRHETLVLFEHVWIALACSAVTIVALGAPLLAHLDPVAVGLCVFLGVGRIGCLVAGCCYGQPSAVGITYGPAAVEIGFPAELSGVRLFPVQLVEATGLAVIGLTGAAAMPFVPAGTVFVWFLLAYAILRFGTEGLRGDERLSIAGLSVARWAAVAQVTFGMWLADPDRLLGPAGIGLALTALAVLVVAAAWRSTRPDRLLTTARHLSDVRSFIERAAGELEASSQPAAQTFRSGLTVAVSKPRSTDLLHVSLSLPNDRRDLRLLCQVGARLLPEAASSTYSRFSGVLHLATFRPLGQWEPSDSTLRSVLHGWTVRQFDADRPRPESEPTTDAGAQPSSSNGKRGAYFGDQPSAGSGTIPSPFRAAVHGEGG